MEIVVNILKYGFLLVFATEAVFVGRSFVRLINEKARVQLSAAPPVEE